MSESRSRGLPATMRSKRNSSSSSWSARPAFSARGDDGADGERLQRVGEVVLLRPPLTGRGLGHDERLGADLAGEEPLDELGLGLPLAGGVGHGAAQGDGAVERVGDAEEVLGQAGAVDLAVEHPLEGVLDGGRRATGRSVHQTSCEPLGAPAEAVSPTDSGVLPWPARSGRTEPDSSSARKRSTMPR